MHEMVYTASTNLLGLISDLTYFLSTGHFDNTGFLITDSELKTVGKAHRFSVCLGVSY